MKEEENVYDETTRAEETTAVSNAEKASTVPSKFKDVDALVRAYGSLQAEFTRRSQRLKELEKMAENFEKGELASRRSGVEKLRKNAQARKAETKQFDEFMAQTIDVNVRETEGNEPEAKPEILEDKPSKAAAVQAEIEQNGGTVYEMNALTDDMAPADKGKTEDGIPKGERGDKFVEGNKSATDLSKDLYEQVSRDEKVRLKIIGEYLSSLGRSGVPLMAGGVGTLATPPIKPKSISEAGNMALLYFKKPKA